MKRPIVVLGLVLLVLAGCREPVPTTPRETEREARRTLVVSASGLATAGTDPRMGMERVTRIWLVSTGSDAATMLPVSARDDQLPRLSPDGTRILYAQAVTSPITQPMGVDAIGRLRIRDLTSHTDSVTLEAPLLTWGWSAAGEPVALSTEETAVPGGSLNVPVLKVFGPHGWTTRSLGPQGPPRWGRVDFIAADSESVYVRNLEVGRAFGRPDVESVWRIDRRTGELGRVSHDTLRGDRTAHVSPDAARHGSRALLDGGLPIDWAVRQPGSGPTTALIGHIEFHRLPDWSLLRSITVTPPVAVRDENVVVFDADLSRYLLSTRTETPGILAIWESSAEATSTTRFIVGTTQTPDPVPLGYAGEDIVYRATRDGRGVIGIFDRETGRSRTLAAVGAPFGRRRDEPGVELLGVIEERTR